jgi:hypothetical protein
MEGERSSGPFLEGTGLLGRNTFGLLCPEIRDLLEEAGVCKYDDDPPEPGDLPVTVLGFKDDGCGRDLYFGFFPAYEVDSVDDGRSAEWCWDRGFNQDRVKLMLDGVKHDVVS